MTDKDTDPVSAAEADDLDLFLRRITHLALICGGAALMAIVGVGLGNWLEPAYAAGLAG